jgi:hypothetical protein
MVFTELIAVAKLYAVYVLRSSYRRKGGLSRKQPLPVHAAIQRSKCNNVEIRGVFKMLL